PIVMDRRRGFDLRNADAVVIDTHTYLVVAGVFERDYGAPRPGVVHDVGQRFSNQLQNVDFFVRRELHADQMIVQRNLDAAAIFKLPHSLLERRGKAPTVHSQTEGGQQLTQLTIRIAQSRFQFLDHWLYLLARGLLVEQRLQPRDLDLLIRQRLRKRIVQFARNDGAFFQQRQAMSFLMAPSQSERGANVITDGRQQLGLPGRQGAALRQFERHDAVAAPPIDERHRYDVRLTFHPCYGLHT